ncbi:MAG: hypothetical protein E7361_00295 [Clostridiales bacterium]|nr:hypothetical protein [Clostridiales bacterium]
MKESFKNSKEYSIAKDIWSLFITMAVFSYLFIGFVADMWHPTWIIFVVAIVLAIICFVINKVRFAKNKREYLMAFDKQFESTHIYAKCVKVSGWLFMLSIAGYIISASFTGLWHPLWLIFIGMAVVEQSMALVFKMSYKDICKNVDVERVINVEEK